MAVFDFAACPGYITHAAGAEIIELCKRCRLMITALVGGREEPRVLGYHIVLQLTHCVEYKTCLGSKVTAGFVQSLFRSALERLAFIVEVRTQHGKRRNLRERIAESRTQTRHYI